MLEIAVRFFIDPFNILLFLLLFCFAGVVLEKTRLLKWTLGITVGWFLLVSTPFLPVLLINSFENQYEPLRVEQLSNLDAEYHIVILGGGHGFDIRLPPNSLLSHNALGRLNEGIRIHRNLPNSKLVLSGFSASGGKTQAEMLQDTALILGVKREATLLQKKPWNTYEEASVYADDFGNKHPVILVTNATHMRRAVMSFKMFEIEPIPSPTNYKLKGSWKKKKIGLPGIDSMELFHTAISEYVAILWYKVSK